MGIRYPFLHAYIWNGGGIVAKGGYMCIAYPDPCFSMDDVINSIEKDGGAVAWILHDKDDCKPHYHIICMWESSPKPWTDTAKRQGFLSWMQEHHCLSPHGSERYSKEIAVIKDIDSALAYMIHSYGA